MDKKIGFIGLGNMASALAGRALASGNAVEIIGRDPAKANEVAAALGKWLATISGDDSALDHNLLEALWTYQTIDVVEPALLRKLLVAKDARARSAAPADVSEALVALREVGA